VHHDSMSINLHRVGDLLTLKHKCGSSHYVCVYWILQRTIKLGSNDKIHTNRTLRNYENVRLYARRSTEYHTVAQMFKLYLISKKLPCSPCRTACDMSPSRNVCSRT